MRRRRAPGRTSSRSGPPPLAEPRVPYPGSASGAAGAAAGASPTGSAARASPTGSAARRSPTGAPAASRPSAGTAAAASGSALVLAVLGQRLHGERPLERFALLRLAATARLARAAPALLFLGVLEHLLHRVGH